MEHYSGLEIAVIGLACRFPKADSVESYWENLKAGRDCISDFSEEELMAAGEPITAINSPDYVRSNAYLENKQYFDAAFFNYMPDEAELMDPQIRLFHECCWEALEGSGYGHADHKEKTGLFAAGTPNPNWELYSIFKNQDGLVDNFTASNIRDITYLSTLVAYKLNLKGPAVYLQTACSSSLVTIHAACNSLLLGECSMALAGGVTVRNHSKQGYQYVEGSIFSADGRCRPFDSRANGTVAGEGAGVVVLKRLKDALRDQDHIYAVIKGSAINNDGNNKIGYTAPGVQGQTEVIRKALKMAGVQPASIGYVENHGTATALGDPAEIQALQDAFSLPGSSYAGKCAIGSVKSNMGHTDNAAGVAGFIKATLAIYHQQLPPSLHFQQPNPAIDFNSGPFYVNAVLQDWKNVAGPLRAGVSSFGIGGTNAHVILEAAPAIVPSITAKDQQLIVLSAKTASSLAQYTARFLDYLEHTNEELSDIAWNLQTGRARYPYRKTLVCSTVPQAIGLLRDQELAVHEAAPVQQALQQIVFLFPGQGTQYSQMCRGLYAEEKTFRDQVDECLRLAKKYSAADLYSILFPAYGEDSRINHTQYAQPLLFIVEYSLSCLLMKWGIKPTGMIGHSIGEYVAACLSGVFSLEDALHLVIRRGELMAGVPEGAMLSVNMSEEQLSPLLMEYPQVELSVVNSPSSLVVAGDKESIMLFEEALTGLGYPAKRLHTSHAFHSRMMEQILPAFEKVVAGVRLQEPHIPYVSNITGDTVTWEAISEPGYWSRHLRNTVHFSAGADMLLGKGKGVLIEVGPGRSLCNYIRESSGLQEGHEVVSLVRQAKQSVDDRQFLLEQLGRCWMYGININWSHYHGQVKKRKLPLPVYVFDKKTFTTDVSAIKLISEQYADVASDSHTIEQAMHMAGWQQSIAPGRSHLRPHEHFLVFSGNEAVSSRLMGLLTAAGHSVAEARMGPAFRVVDKQVLEVAVTAQDSLAAMWNYLDEHNIPVTHILYNAALSDGQGGAYESPASTLNNGYLALSCIARSIGSRRSKGKLQVTVVNNHLAAVTREDRVDPVKAALHGPARIMPVEMPNITCKTIDLPYPFPNDDIRENYLSLLIHEIGYTSGEPFVAYRHQERWVRSYNQVPEDRSVSSGVDIIPGGHYIIVGGFGGIGFTIARDLVHRHGAQVIIIHRSPFPARNEWEQWLATTPATDHISKRIEAIRQMESTGSSISFYQADVAVEQEVKELVSQLRVQYPRINGLIWAVGEIDYGGILLNRSQETLERYLTGKVRGLLYFEKYFDLCQLDFLSLFSSVGNVLYQQQFGQVAYQAANQFLESYAYYARQTKGVHAFAINWCAWLDVGMAVQSLRQEPGLEDIRSINAKIKGGIDPAEGLSIFYACIRARVPVTVVYKGNINKAIRSLRSMGSETGSQALGTGALPEAMAATPGTIQENLTNVFAAFFGKSSIGPRDNFFDLGGDSLKGMTLVARINKKLGTGLSIGDLYRLPTIEALVQEISGYTEASVVQPIPRAAHRKSYRLSSAQKRMYFLQQLYKDSVAYNETQLLTIRGQLDKIHFLQAFRQLVKRHESLRTLFLLENGDPVQVIREDMPFDIEWFEPGTGELASIIQSFIRPFDLSCGPLFRIGLVEQQEGSSLLLIDWHHIITDGISRNILIRDFLQLYSGHELPELSLQYKDYAEWQQSGEQQAAIASHKGFWAEAYADLPETLELPLDLPRPAVKTYEGNTIDFTIDATTTAGLRSVAAEEGASLFMVLLAAFNILLSRLSGQEDLVVGIPTGGRQQHADLEAIIGMFSNTVVLRNQPVGELSCREFLQQVKANTLACFDHQSYPYEELVNDLRIARHSARNPLFDVMFVYQSFEQLSLDIPGASVAPYAEAGKIAKFDLTLEVTETGELLSLHVNYLTALFTTATINRWINYFKMIVAALIDHPDQVIGRIALLTDAEKQQVLPVFNQTIFGIDPSDTVIRLFDAQVVRTPDNTAVTCGDTAISYAVLQQRAAKITAWLQQVALVQPGDLVGILMDRDEQLMPCLLGVLKAGAAYVPIDPGYPDERIQAIIDSAGSPVILTDALHATTLAVKGYRCVVPEHHWDAIQALAPASSVVVTGDQPAYVIFTSGSTGQPKGVVITHHSLANYIIWAARTYITGKAVFPLFTSISFDLTVTSIFTPLITGQEIVLYKEAGKTGLIEKVIAEQKATVIKLTPSHLKIVREMVLPANIVTKPLVFIVGGEDLESALAQAIYHKFQGEVVIYNEYGPTEATVGCMIHQYNPGQELSSVPIGVPVANTRIYLLDRFLQPVPCGVKGELYIAGAGLAAGYLDNEALTHERFPEDPFVPGERMYRSGDWARALADGRLVYGGRIDEQVKINGFRIEPGDIERQLAAYPGIGETVVVTWKRGDAAYLVAYYTAALPLEVAHVRAFLSQRLPDYMVPWHFVQLAQWPLTANGKLNRNALPEPAFEKGAAHVAATTDVQERLVKIWSAVLDIPAEDIGIHANFFELGGHSLKMVALNRMVNDAFQTNIPVVEMFRLPAIANMEQFIVQGDQGTHQLAGSIEQVLSDTRHDLDLINELIDN